MSWTLCTSAQAIAKTGLASTAIDLTVIDDFSDAIEGSFVGKTRRNWRSSYSSVNADIKNFIADACSSGIANRILLNQPQDWSGRTTETLIDVNDDIWKDGISTLKDFKTGEIKEP